MPIFTANSSSSLVYTHSHSKQMVQKSHYWKLVEDATLEVKYTQGDKSRCTVDRTHAVHILDQQDMKLDLETLAGIHDSRGKLTATQAGSFPFPLNKVNQQHKNDCTPWLSPKSLLWKEKSDLPKIMCCIDTICIVNTYLLEEYTPTLIYKQLTEVPSIPAS